MHFSQSSLGAGIKPHLPTVIRGLLTHALLATFPSQYHFPTLLLAFHYLINQLVPESLSQSLPLGEPKLRPRSLGTKFVFFPSGQQCFPISFWV